MTVSPSPSPKGVTVSAINRLCAIFLNNPEKTYVPKDFKQKESWNYSSVKKQLRRLLNYGIIKQLTNGKYILDNREKGIEFLEQNSDTLSPTTEPSRHIRTKKHEKKSFGFDLSGEPLEWLKKLNMVTKPGNDNAQNVTLRQEIAKKFNLVISLCTGNASLYILHNGWDEEFCQIFPWGKEVLKQKNIINELGVAINYNDLKSIHPEYPPIDELDEFELISDGLTVRFCKSQFPEHEVCVHGEVNKVVSSSKEFIEGIKGVMDKINLESQINKKLTALDTKLDIMINNLTSLPDAIAKSISKAMEGNYNYLKPDKPDERIDVR